VDHFCQPKSMVGVDYNSPYIRFLIIAEIGRICAFEREQLAIRIDKQLSGHSDHLDWPISPSWVPEMDADILSDFSNEYIDILPPNWDVISISLSSDHTEFVISKLCLGSVPFLLRLPLKRGNSEEEEEEFTFDTGKREMKEIIHLANTTAHDARSRIDKSSKKEWWETRESLDRRLEALLCNIEHIWLGGFRGIFSPSHRNPDLFARFTSSFHHMLDKHLPSRQKGRNSEEKRLMLHQNVLELFIGLQNLDDQMDPEDSIMDLLYFVVDILQFQGERNAYDEIDFDVMVVETLGILRSYQEATQDSHQPKHTILIIDKMLHLFPWESLPCMHGLPVSRMPSIKCLRDRILQCQLTPKELALEGLRVNRDNGTYVLNPSGDLKTTQNTFEESLSTLKSWTAIANREPSEDEFKENLESKNVFLYFGHGSGAQYIRGRTIKRLNQCAVTFLMGCSSGCLTEAGEFEPYGTPMNYMHAGTPAVVATLWDVTDKDIDRFAKTTFEKWGLVCPNDGNDSSVSIARTSESQSIEKGISSPDVELRESLALDEAVANSRDSCLLRYLNGAAPVVYGIPVFLSI
jgi:separase